MKAWYRYGILLIIACGICSVALSQSNDSKPTKVLSLSEASESISQLRTEMEDVKKQLAEIKLQLKANNPGSGSAEVSTTRNVVDSGAGQLTLTMQGPDRKRTNEHFSADGFTVQGLSVSDDSGDNSILIGEVTNNSKDTASLTITFTVFDANGDLIDTDDVSIESLKPGEASSFKNLFTHAPFDHFFRLRAKIEHDP